MKAGWEVKALGDVCETVSTGPFGSLLGKKDYTDTGVPLVNPIDIVDGAINAKSTKKVSTETAHRLSSYRMQSGDIVVARRGELGRCAKVTDANNDWLCGTGSFFIRPSKAILADYLEEYIRSPTSQAIFEAASTGATMPNISNKTLSKLPIPLPPLEEQKQIVAVLDAAFEGLTRARTHVETNLQNARELFGNLLDAVFTDCPDHWVKSNLGETCKFVGGSQPPKSNFVAEPGEGLVRLVQIRDYKNDKNIVYVPRSLVRRFCSPDDVMIGRYGPPLFQILRGIDGAYNVALMKAEPDEAKVSKDFLFLFLRNSRIWRYINDASSRAAGQIGLNKATIEPYPIAYPNIDEQKVVVKRLMEAEADCKQAEALYKTKLQDLDDLRQSLLQKAFAGELT